MNKPKAYVKWGKVPALLAQANTGGIKCTAVLFQNGELLSIAGDTPAKDVVLPVVSNMWRQIDEGSSAAFGADRFYFLVAECEDGKMAVTKVGEFLLCMYADADVETGLLKSKVAAFSACLEEPLLQVFPSS